MTKLPGSVRNRNLLALAMLTAALMAPRSSMAQTHCFQGNGTLNGLYMSNAIGTLVGVGPISAASLVQFNGDGTLVLVSETFSINGAVSKIADIPGTYSVNRDCTGSYTIGTGPTASTFDFIISPDGNTVSWIATNPGEVCAGRQERVWR